MKTLSLKITSHHFLLCVFLSLLWDVTDSSTISPDTTLTPTVTSSTEEKMTTLLTTPLTTPLPPPQNAKQFQSIERNETSITLQWKKVNGTFNYTLLFNGAETHFTASEGDELVNHTILNLKSATKYDFTLYTVHKNIRSSGVNISAFTAPPDVDQFQSIERNETSITLQWKKVDDILDYTLSFNGTETNITATTGNEPVTYTATGLISGTIYSFTLFTLFENIRSSGVKHTAATAPRNTEEFISTWQNETSITLQWKKVDDILDYTLSFNGTETNITATTGNEPVTYTDTGLISGTIYSFTLFTLFENIRSSGVKHTAATAPRNTEEFISTWQNETSITLQWKKVDDILDYTLSFNGTETNFTATTGNEPVTYTATGLISGTIYSFTLFTLFENIRSSGVKHTAATAPRNTEEFISTWQNETSITLQWKKVDDILDYTLLFNGTETNITATTGNEPVTYTDTGLISGTIYSFTLFTLFENIRSSGVKHTAATAPRNTEEFISTWQNETSITLQWKKVDDILDYTLSFNGNETNITATTRNEPVTYTATELISGTIYSFTLFTLFENIRSSRVNITAATVPSMVASVNVTERSETSVTLAWNVDMDKDWSYILQIDGRDLQPEPVGSKDVLSSLVSSLQPGTRYNFSVITTFYGHNSTEYTNFTITEINCACETWHVNTSSIHGKVEGLVSTAKVTNESYNRAVITEGGNVLLTGLYPGATYMVSLEYETENRPFKQCNCAKTTQPPKLQGDCQYWAAGYSALFEWNKPDGIWTIVQITVNGDEHNVSADEKQLEVSGFLPARTYDVSVVSFSGDERSEPYVFQCTTDPRGVIAGSVFGVLLFGVLVCLVVVIFLKWPHIISRKNQFISGSKVSNKTSKVISVAKFPDRFYSLSADENRGFSQEYESLSPVGTEQARKEATRPENKARNRFNNVLPYDWCRVKLSTSSSDATSDYINANYMPGYNSNREYIATQGPLPTTVNDFWRMIWEQRVKRIIMVTNCIESGRTKCEQYWPADNEPCLYGELMVTIRSEQQEPNWTLRDFRLKHSNSSEERTVKHFHFTAWPDDGVPQCTEVLIHFRELVRQHIQREGAGAPTVVHCSAGVGRTGTIIALDVLLQQLEKDRAVGINSFVHKMRLSRPHMVQTESQYIFLHQCIMDCLQPKEKTEENIYENADMIYANATALQEFHTNP